MSARLAVLCAAAASACTAGATCPDGFRVIGTFSLSFFAADAGDSCVVTHAADGGPTDAGVTSAPSSTSIGFCAPADGGPQLWVELAGASGQVVSLDAGFFSTASSGTGISGSNCLCALDVAETFSGRLETADGRAFGPDGEGGFTQVTGFNGNLDERLSSSQSGCGVASIRWTV